MAIYTPNGLKIDIDTKLAFTYIARIYPKYSAYKILKTVEGLELLPGTLAVLSGICCFIFGFSTLNIALYTGLFTLLGGLIIRFGIFIFPRLMMILITIGTLNSYLLLYVIVIIIGLITVGWRGILFFFIGRYGAGLLNEGIEFISMKIAHKKFEILLSTSERNFFHSYRLHAIRMGLSKDLNLKDGELESDNWKAPFKDLKQKIPSLTEMFTDFYLKNLE